MPTLNFRLSILAIGMMAVCADGFAGQAPVTETVLGDGFEAMDASALVRDAVDHSGAIRVAASEHWYSTQQLPDSLTVLDGCLLEPGLAGCTPEDRFQFERQGYFCADPVASRPGRPVFKRIVTLRDSWAKQNEAT